MIFRCLSLPEICFSLLFSSANPFIEIEGNNIIKDLSDNEITALNIEEDSLNVGNNAWGNKAFHYFSEGRKTRINLALRIAISRILSSLPATDEQIMRLCRLVYRRWQFLSYVFHIPLVLGVLLSVIVYRAVGLCCLLMALLVGGRPIYDKFKENLVKKKFRKKF